jgi:hypothetical protein
MPYNVIKGVLWGFAIPFPPHKFIQIGGLNILGISVLLSGDQQNLQSGLRHYVE